MLFCLKCFFELNNRKFLLSKFREVANIRSTKRVVSGKKPNELIIFLFLWIKCTSRNVFNIANALYHIRTIFFYRISQIERNYVLQKMTGIESGPHTGQTEGFTKWATYAAHCIRILSLVLTSINWNMCIH